MTIKKGQPWGQQVSTPGDLMVFDDDAGADEYVSRQFSESLVVQGVAIRESNLARALGLKGSVIAQTMLSTTFDLIEVKFLGSDTVVSRKYFLGHAMIKNSWLRGGIVGIFNTSFVGKHDWAPRAHPNDGKFDVLIVDENMGVRQRLTARHLLKSGSHIPHPQIKYSQTNEFAATELRDARLTIDGVDFGPIKSCSFRLICDAVTLYW